MIKVTLRTKTISNNRQALYLDFYPPIQNPETGKATRRDFLKLFLYNDVEYKCHVYNDSDGKQQRKFLPVLDRNGKQKKVRLNENEKRHNSETIALAEAIKAQRQIALQSGSYGFLSEDKLEKNFIEYFESIAAKRIGSNSDNWESCLNYLKEFTKGNKVRFKELNEKFCNEFKSFLLTSPSRKSKEVTLSQNSALSYFTKFKAALKQAYADGFLNDDLNKRIKSINAVETERQYLTFDELQILVNTSCSKTVFKNAALFSALTGLRFSDIKKLIWREVQFDSTEGCTLRFRQKKAKGTETLPISDVAMSLLGERTNDVDLVFPGLEYSQTQSILPKWISQAGINRNITFHSFRHTYATLLISSNIDIYTVSKMLGHREIKTTQVYAKIMDKQKRIAANSIKIKF